jgi:hypothetical protein
MRWLARLFGRTPSPAVAPDQWERALALARKSMRSCWAPLTEPRDPDGAMSKFGGSFWLPAGESWPRCAYCRSPLQPFVQLRASDLPAEAGDPFPGLLQLFYCTSAQCDPPADAWNGFGKNQLARVIPAPGAGGPASFPANDTIPVRRITGWTKTDDCPGRGEVSHTWPPELEGLFYEHGEKFGVRPFPQQGDKLLGWPDWVQNVEYVNCPDCAKPMRYLFQIDSEDNIPYMFGDAGVGHISFCPDHPHRAAFLWACC